MFDFTTQGFDELGLKVMEYEKNIDQLEIDMPNELIEWQREDMKRKYPNMDAGKTGNTTTAATSIWSRSRESDKPKSRLNDRRRIRRQGPRQYGNSTFRQVRSNRPILRAELLKNLYQRMTKLVEESMRWPK